MRRSELLEVCVQTLAVLQLCTSAGPSSSLFSSLPTKTLQAMITLLPMVIHLLRPRRLEDDVVQRYHLGPHRLEAFVRRPDEDMLIDVYKVIRDISPFIPRSLGWACESWPARPQDNIEGMSTGGAFISLQREVEVPPFVVCLVLRPKVPAERIPPEIEHGEEDSPLETECRPRRRRGDVVAG